MAGPSAVACAAVWAPRDAAIAAHVPASSRCLLVNIWLRGRPLDDIPSMVLCRSCSVAKGVGCTRSRQSLTQQRCARPSHACALQYHVQGQSFSAACHRHACSLVLAHLPCVRAAGRWRMSTLWN